MHSRSKRSAYVGILVEPELRAAVEEEAARRDTSMSSTIRALIRAQLAAMQAANRQAVV